MNFWFKVNVVSATDGFSLIWDKHMAISVTRDSTVSTTMAVICFPQEYKVSPKDKQYTDLLNLQNSTANSDKNLLVGKDATWTYARCGFSTNQNEYYLITDTNISTPKSTVNELYHGTQRSDYPLRYFLNPGTTGTLTLNKISSATQFVSIRLINTFIDYLPPNLFDTRWT